MLDVHRLVLLREVHLRGSMTAAARSLSYTHSAVSQQLALLEKEAGVPLLERVGRGVQLTPAAEELVHHTNGILAILERAEADLAASATQVRGTLRLAAFTTISRYAVPQVLTALGRRHPALDVRFAQVEPEEGLLMLSSRRVDVVVADSYPGTAARSEWGQPGGVATAAVDPGAQEVGSGRMGEAGVSAARLRARRRLRVCRSAVPSADGAGGVGCGVPAGSSGAG